MIEIKMMLFLPIYSEVEKNIQEQIIKVIKDVL